jgi:hypothetical protein
VGTIDTTNFDMLYPSSPVRIKELVRMRQPQLYDALQIAHDLTKNVTSV